MSSNRSPDGRFGTACATANGATNDPVCFVPFARLIATPEKYDGKVISLIGFLVTSHGFPTLFLSSENYRAQTVYDNVFVDSVIPHDILPKLRQGVWVEVIGKFDAKFSGDQAMNMGAIRDLASLAERPPLELSAPKPPTFKPVQLPAPKLN